MVVVVEAEAEAAGPMARCGKAGFSNTCQARKGAMPPVGSGVAGRCRWDQAVANAMRGGWRCWAAQGHRGAVCGAAGHTDAQGGASIQRRAWRECGPGAQRRAPRTRRMEDKDRWRIHPSMRGGDGATCWGHARQEWIPILKLLRPADRRTGGIACDPGSNCRALGSKGMAGEAMSSHWLGGLNESEASLLGAAAGRMAARRTGPAAARCRGSELCTSHLSARVQPWHGGSSAQRLATMAWRRVR